MSKPPLARQTICITGTLSVPRADFVALIEAAGAKWSASVIKAADALIVGADPSQAKLDKATEHNIPIWDEYKARRIMAGEDKTLYTFKVYGSSDDLVEIDGAVRDELQGGDEDTFIRFTNGTYVAIRYGDEGIWRARVIDEGTSKVRKLFGMPEDEGAEPQAHKDPDAPLYSDVLIIESETKPEIEIWGRKPLPPPRVGMKKAKAIIDLLEGRGGFDDWWNDVDQDDKTEILEALAELLEEKG